MYRQKTVCLICFICYVAERNQIFGVVVQQQQSPQARDHRYPTILRSCEAALALTHAQIVCIYPIWRDAHSHPQIFGLAIKIYFICSRNRVKADTCDGVGKDSK